MLWLFIFHFFRMIECCTPAQTNEQSIVQHFHIDFQFFQIVQHKLKSIKLFFNSSEPFWNSKSGVLFKIIRNDYCKLCNFLLFFFKTWCDAWPLHKYFLVTFLPGQNESNLQICFTQHECFQNFDSFVVVKKYHGPIFEIKFAFKYFFRISALPRADTNEKWIAFFMNESNETIFAWWSKYNTNTSWKLPNESEIIFFNNSKTSKMNFLDDLTTKHVFGPAFFTET